MPRRHGRHTLAAAVLAAAAACLSGACASSPTAESAYVTVLVEFVERPPQDAFLNVTLEQRTEAGERHLVGRSMQRVGFASPVEIRVLFDPNDIDPTAHYEVRASFDQRGTLILDSGGEPVLTHGNPSSAFIRFGRRPVAGR